eukprot:gnl/Hemi2/15186_TR5122_c0_g1_i1.p2 gnl/Hemi2/15186_TR5122_c0_g1~~gnl/Hemi2/15186_TR5122_c0_g1_i1.p2  ORF type:complete len:121 (+),score=33.19 gnl/Hemi2/15186_TR5122_c0_g1_i1:388-750(+)
MEGKLLAAETAAQAAEDSLARTNLQLEEVLTRKKRLKGELDRVREVEQRTQQKRLALDEQVEALSAHQASLSKKFAEQITEKVQQEQRRQKRLAVELDTARKTLADLEASVAHKSCCCVQ